MFKRFHLGRNWFIPVFSVFAVLIMAVLLWYSNRLVGRLAAREERLVNFWAQTIQFIANPGEEEGTFLFNNLIKKKIIPVPAIMTDSAGKPVLNNIDLPTEMSKGLQDSLLKQELLRMRANKDFRPLKIEFLPGQLQYIYYRETDELRLLRFFPYLTLGVLATFLVVLFTNLYIAQRNEQNRVWVGLARETAHQLGTPISGLMAWIELLRTRHEAPDDQQLIGELETDVRHLELIAERFSKIGSEPELVEADVNLLLSEAVDYCRKRASHLVTLDMRSELPNDFRARLNPTLFAWVVENLLKNALDALIEGKGTITVTAASRNGQLIIEVDDTGKGMNRAQMRRAFRPGFTTKKRGWGLGLSLSKRIIEQYHRGHIFIRRSELRKGTTFRIQLPMGR
jgi:signal transduction histidine kinase